eukprot:1086389-Rhodomonas_salina.1
MVVQGVRSRVRGAGVHARAGMSSGSLLTDSEEAGHVGRGAPSALRVGLNEGSPASHVLSQYHMCSTTCALSVPQYCLQCMQYHMCSLSTTVLPTMHAVPHVRSQYHSTAWQALPHVLSQYHTPCYAATMCYYRILPLKLHHTTTCCSHMPLALCPPVPCISTRHAGGTVVGLSTAHSRSTTYPHQRHLEAAARETGTEIERERDSDRQTQKVKNTDRGDRETATETDRQTVRQEERERETGIDALLAGVLLGAAPRETETETEIATATATETETETERVIEIEKER